MASTTSPRKKSKSRSAGAELRMADPMKIRANVVGDSTEVKVLMSHEMETGQRKDAQGKTIPAWHIQSVAATWNGKTVLTAEWGPAVSKNPFLSFKFKGGAK